MNSTNTTQQPPPSNTLIPISSIFVLYLIISSNYFVPLYSCRLQAFFQQNMIMRHVFGYFTMLFFAVLATNLEWKLVSTMLLSFGLYLWYVATTRMNFAIWSILMILFGGLYLLYLYYQRDTDTNHPNRITIEQIYTYGSILALVLTLFGCILYIGEKKYEYKSKFSWITFWLGKSKCKQQSPSISFLKALQSAFK